MATAIVASPTAAAPPTVAAVVAVSTSDTSQAAALSAADAEALLHVVSQQKHYDMSAMTIVIDCREGRGCGNLTIAGLASALAAASGAKVVQMELPICDFLLVDEQGQILCAMERKTVGDMKGSLVSGHAAEQFARMGKLRGMNFDGLRMPDDPTLPHMGLLFVGNWIGVEGGMAKAVSGIMSRAQMVYRNFPVIPVQSDSLLPYVLAAHFARVLEFYSEEYHGYPKLPLLHEIKTSCRKDRIDAHPMFGISALANIHRMSPMLAERVMAKFNSSLWEVLRASRDQGLAAFTDIPGIGSKIAKSLVSVLRDPAAEAFAAAAAYRATLPPEEPKPAKKRSSGSAKPSKKRQARYVATESSDDEDDDDYDEYDYDDGFLATDDDLADSDDEPVHKAPKRKSKLKKRSASMPRFVMDEASVGDPDSDEEAEAAVAAVAVGLAVSVEDDGIDFGNDEPAPAVKRPLVLVKTGKVKRS